MKTPQAKIKKIVLDQAIYKTIKDAEEGIRKHGADDYIAVAGILYTMMEYDMDGQNIDYYNRRTDNLIQVDTHNRYKGGFGDAVVSLFENYGAYRNDINYAD